MAKVKSYFQDEDNIKALEDLELEEHLEKTTNRDYIKEAYNHIFDDYEDEQTPW